MRWIKFCLVAATGGLLLTACGDGSVRSPGLLGPGELESIELQCRTPTGSPCETVSGPDDDLDVVQAGAFVNYRVIGNFSTGARLDITNDDEYGVELLLAPPQDPPEDGPAATLTENGENKGRVRGNIQSNEPADPVVILAEADTGESEPFEDGRGLLVVGGIPEDIAVFGDSQCTEPADDLLLASGASRQLYARVTFDNSDDVAPICRSEDPRLVWSAEPGTNPDGSDVINEQTGLFTGKNDDTEDNAAFEVTATFREEDDPDAANFDEISQNAEIEVAPAEIDCDAGIELNPSVVRTVIGDTVAFDAEATFLIDDDGTTVTDNVTGSATFTSNAPDLAEFEDPENAPGELSTLAATEASAPVEVTATLDTPDCPAPLEASADVSILEADFQAIKLVAVGVAPFEDAGLIDDETPQAERDRIANDALALGTDRDGRLPVECTDTQGDDCVDETLDQHQTLPGAQPLAYVVAGVPQDDPDNPVVLDEFPVVCPDGAELPLDFDVDNDDIRVLRNIQNPGSGEMEPATTASGTRIVLVEGLNQGEGTLRARLGASFSDPDVDNGFNCQITGEDGDFEQQTVEDAEQDVLIGLPGTPSISATRFNIDRNFACVGFANAATTLEGDGARGRDKLRTSLAYEFSDGQRYVVNANQNRFVSFGEDSGTADPEGQQSCLNEGGNSAKLTVSNSLDGERGVVTADGVDLGTGCVSAGYAPDTPLPGFDGFDQRAATYVVLPADDDIIRSGNDPDDVQELCTVLEPVLTLLPLDNQSSGVVTDLVTELGDALGPILDESAVEGDASGIVEDALTEVSGLLGELGLTDVFQDLLGVIGDLLGSGSGSPLAEITAALDDLKNQLPGSTQDQETETDLPEDPFDAPAP